MSSDSDSETVNEGPEEPLAESSSSAPSEVETNEESATAEEEWPEESPAESSSSAASEVETNEESATAEDERPEDSPGESSSSAPSEVETNEESATAEDEWPEEASAEDEGAEDERPEHGGQKRPNRPSPKPGVERFEASEFGTLEEHARSHDFRKHIGTCGACTFWKTDGHGARSCLKSIPSRRKRKRGLVARTALAFARCATPTRMPELPIGKPAVLPWAAGACSGNLVCGNTPAPPSTARR